MFNASAYLLGTISLSALILQEPAKTEENSKYESAKVFLSLDFKEDILSQKLGKQIEEAIPVFEKELHQAFPSEAKIIIHLFKDSKDCRAALAGQNEEEFNLFNAATSWRNNESYVVVLPRTEPEYFNTVDHLPETTARMALHQAAHQFVNKSGLFPFQFLPDWYREGMANYLAEFVLTGGEISTQSRSIYFSSLHAEAGQELRDKEIFPLKDLLEKGYKSSDMSAYKCTLRSLSLYAFLADSKNGQWNKLLLQYQKQLHQKKVPPRDVSPGPTIEENIELFKKLLGSYSTLEAAWRKATASEKDSLWQLNWGDAQYRKDEIVLTTIPSGNHSLVVNRSSKTKKHFDIQGEVFIQKIGERQAEIFLQKTEDPYQLIVLTLEENGSISLNGFQNDKWTAFNKATNDPQHILADGWRKIKIQVDGNEVRAEYEDIKFQGTVPKGWEFGKSYWGLGGFKSIVSYRNIKF